ncbi:MAG: hypothetical protein GX829_10205, partial [Clostridium sp.]|nr:hypothetical protein [Clostridium sp.]
IKNRRLYLVPVLILSAVLIYFYLGIFFDSGVNYYEHFLKEQPGSTENSVTIYKGSTSEGVATIKSTVMNQADRLVEVNVGDYSKEYVIESTLDCTEVRLFDSENNLILEGSVNIEEGTLTTSMGTSVNYMTYKPIEGDLYNKTNPDPILLIIIANGLADISRGDISKLMFAALLYFTLIIDFIFPDFFLRFKSLTFKGPVEMPKYYKKMQKISWIVVPIIIVGILLNALL